MKKFPKSEEARRKLAAAGSPAVPTADPFAQLILQFGGQMAKAQARVDIIPAGASPGAMRVTGGEVPGVILAFRSGGDEVLFAAADGRPLTWIEVGAFAIDPRAFRLKPV